MPLLSPTRKPAAVHHHRLVRLRFRSRRSSRLSHRVEITLPAYKIATEPRASSNENRVGTSHHETRKSRLRSQRNLRPTGNEKSHLRQCKIPVPELGIFSDDEFGCNSRCNNPLLATPRGSCRCHPHGRNFSSMIAISYRSRRRWQVPWPKKKKRKKKERQTNSPIRHGRTTESELIADGEADRDGAEADQDGHSCRIFSVTDELSSGDE
ncbi:hypothetical protein TIFTF001_013826 [Ficus carica]|uniref:Uncharacterized protein n=1 Tax=Ficus carica TaxID=3494 RepID=A0AA88A2Q9_FICCA|nr:hypothetical protein TIFTF001_013826 [Ficus carica]